MGRVTVSYPSILADGTHFFMVERCGKIKKWGDIAAERPQGLQRVSWRPLAQTSVHSCNALLHWQVTEPHQVHITEQAH